MFFEAREFFYICFTQFVCLSAFSFAFQHLFLGEQKPLPSSGHAQVQWLPSDLSLSISAI
jgi:hypothetical protein